MELEAPASVIMTIYNPFSANLNATKPEHGGEVERNCVVVRGVKGGKWFRMIKLAYSKLEAMTLAVFEV